MITVNIMGQFKAMKESKDLKCKTAIISITGKYAGDVDFCQDENLVDVLHLHFEDYDYDNEDAMTKEDAARIAEFLDKNKDEICRLIVHCGLGMSRSVGTAHAIVDFFQENDNKMAENGGEKGNAYCYKLVTEALAEHFSDKTQMHCIIGK